MKAFVFPGQGSQFVGMGKETGRILKDHGELVAAIEKKDKEKAAHISQRHMSRYSENIDAIRKMFPEYFND